MKAPRLHAVGAKLVQHAENLDNSAANFLGNELIIYGMVMGLYSVTVGRTALKTGDFLLRHCETEVKQPVEEPQAYPTGE